MAKLIGKLIAEVNTWDVAASDTRALKAARENEHLLNKKQRSVG